MGDVRTAPRAKARRIVTRIGWRLGMRWYGLTSRFKAKDGHEVRPAGSIRELDARMAGTGDRFYKLDPLGGKLDVMRHPRLVQRALDEGRKAGDCDDTAGGYRAAVLLKSELASEVYLATVTMADAEGMSAHAFTKFKVDGDARWHFADYGATETAETSREVFLKMAASFDAKPIIGTWKRVELRDDDGIRFVRGGGVEVWRG